MLFSTPFSFPRSMLWRSSRSEILTVSRLGRDFILGLGCRNLVLSLRFCFCHVSTVNFPQTPCLQTATCLRWGSSSSILLSRCSAVTGLLMSSRSGGGGPGRISSGGAGVGSCPLVLYPGVGCGVRCCVCGTWIDCAEPGFKSPVAPASRNSG